MLKFNKGIERNKWKIVTMICVFLFATFDVFLSTIVALQAVIMHTIFLQRGTKHTRD